ncbi:hypothetical protein [Paenibacillus protaetiae]|uniref:hypothetical protein n=1 Tax=Paenibacillus protaetiae TaxID=2509456 RepID=UPI00244B3B0E|nr:hypothetical protein [Paenibacillus protaetiae]
MSVGLPRAHSITVLNEPDTGRPHAMIHSALPSIIRTAAVSGLLLRYYRKERPASGLSAAVIGWGPIGRHHLQMCDALLGETSVKCACLTSAALICHLFRRRCAAKR